MSDINPFDHKRFIGYVSHVSPQITKIHFPSSPLLKRFYHAGETLHSGLVGSYMAIEGDGYGFLGRLVSVTLPEKERLQLNESSFQKKEMHPVGEIEILLTFDVYKVEPQKGLGQLPPVGAKVYACSTRFLQEFLQKFGSKADILDDDPSLFSIASLAQDSTAVIKISADALFRRHCAIVGSTGGGKSYTVSKLLEQILEKGGKAILIDATGEFKTIDACKGVEVAEFNVKSDASDDDNSTFFHYSNLHESDLIALFRPSGQVQAPKLQEAIKSLKLVHELIKKSGEDDMHAETFVSNHVRPAGDKSLLHKMEDPYNKSVLAKYLKRNALLKVEKEYLPDSCHAGSQFDISALPYQVMNECVYLCSRDSGQSDSFGGQAQNDLAYCQSLMSRINYFLRDPNYKDILGLNKGLSESDSEQELIKKLEKFFSEENKNNILRISLENVPFGANVRPILVNAISRYLLNQARQKKFVENPIVLFVDEAHQFFDVSIKDEYSLETPLDALDSIAKECRKYGLFLTISTQRPRDISAGTLSQIGAFIAHRLINAEDRRAVEGACSDASKHALSFLPILGEGEALLMGVEFPAPILLKITKSSLKPDSGTPHLKFKQTGE